MTGTPESAGSLPRGKVQRFASRVRGDRSLSIALAVFAVLLVIDLAFISAHVAMRLEWIDTRSVNLENEGTLPELWQHLKVLGIAGMFVVGLVLRRRSVYLVGALLFGYLFLDDSFEFHERFGRWSAEAWQLPSVAGLEPKDLGELIWGGVIGSAIIAMLWWTWRRSTSSERRFLLRLGIVLLAFAGCAFGVDMLHQISQELGLFRTAYAFGTLEDGGELVCMSAAAGVVLHYLLGPGASDESPPRRSP